MRRAVWETLLTQSEPNWQRRVLAEFIHPVAKLTPYWVPWDFIRPLHYSARAAGWPELERKEGEYAGTYLTRLTACALANSTLTGLVVIKLGVILARPL